MLLISLQPSLRDSHSFYVTFPAPQALGYFQTSLAGLFQIHNPQSPPVQRYGPLPPSDHKISAPRPTEFAPRCLLLWSLPLGTLSLTGEEELIRRAQGGDLEAFCRLAREYERRVYTLALHYCRDPTDAEDLSQEVWLKAFKSLGGFRFESS